MAWIFLKTLGQRMTFTQFQAECVSMFSLHIKTSKVKSATNSVGSSRAPREHKTYSQKKGNQEDRKVQAQTELIAQQKCKIDYLKAVQTTRASSQQLVTAIPEAMSCLYVGS